MHQIKTIKIIKLLLIIVLVGSSFFVFAKDNKSPATKTKKNVDSALPEGPPSQAVENQTKIHSLGLAVGQTFLNGKLGRYGDDGVTPELFYNYSVSHSFGFVANFHHSKHELKGYFTKITGLALSIKGNFYQFDSFSPFAMAGLGFYIPQTSRMVNNVITESKRKLTFGTNIGLGGELRLNRHCKLWLLATHHNPFDIKQDLGPKVEGRYSKLLIAGFYSF